MGCKQSCMRSKLTDQSVFISNEKKIKNHKAVNTRSYEKRNMSTLEKNKNVVVINTLENTVLIKT